MTGSVFSDSGTSRTISSTVRCAGISIRPVGFARLLRCTFPIVAFSFLLSHLPPAFQGFPATVAGQDDAARCSLQHPTQKLIQSTLLLFNQRLLRLYMAQQFLHLNAISSQFSILGFYVFLNIWLFRYHPIMIGNFDGNGQDKGPNLRIIFTIFCGYNEQLVLQEQPL